MRKFRGAIAAFAVLALLAPGIVGTSKAEPVVDACASKDGVLGLSRVVEIETEGGPIFGGSHNYNNFLRPGEVVLTFDDGPMRGYTRSVLKALKEHCTKATFFMVGRMAAADPAMVKEVAAQGHTIGSHTWSHQNLKPINLIKARQEFELGISAVSKAAGKPIAPFFRYPFLSENRMLTGHAQKRNVATFFIDVDSKDFQTRNPQIVRQRIMGELAQLGKGIILMHDIQPSTAHAIKDVLNDLHAKGYKVVHMVPAENAGTIAEFDAPAEEAVTAKAEAAKAKPLADRSVVWTMAKPDEADLSPQPAVRPAVADRPEAAAAAAAPEKPAGGKEQLPWAMKPAVPAAAAPVTTSSTTTSAAAAKPKTAAVKRPTRRFIEDLPWQMRHFQE